jgi:tetratricopeptide (TPR) repeat protein
MVKNFIILFIIFSSQVSEAQDTKQLDIFRSEHEYALFTKVLEDTTNFDQLFQLFWQTNTDLPQEEMGNWEASMNNVVEEIVSNKKFKKGGEKAMAVLHNTVHTNFFRMYEFKAYPEMINDNGVFNCVTATGLTYMVANKLGLAAYINEEPNHVYLTIELGNEAFPMETTDPSKGYNKFSTASKKETVRQLLNYKLLDPAVYDGMGEEEIFDKIYQKKRRISLLELIAIQYMNQGYFASEKGDVHDAVKQFTKAYMLMNNNHTTIVLTSAVIQEIAHDKFEHEDYDQSLVLLAKLNTAVNLDKIFIPFYQQFSHTALVEANELNRFVQVSNNIDSILIDNVKHSIFEFEYQYRLAQYYYQIGELKLSMLAVNNTLLINPDHMDMLQFYVALKAKELYQQDITKEAIADLMNDGEKYPRLNTMLDFKNLTYYTILKKIEIDLYQKNIKEVLHSLDIVDHQVSLAGSVVNKVDLAHVYEQIALIYFERNAIGSANKYINEAIKFDPNNSKYRNLKAIFNN